MKKNFEFNKMKFYGAKSAEKVDASFDCDWCDHCDGCDAG